MGSIGEQGTVAETTCDEPGDGEDQVRCSQLANFCHVPIFEVPLELRMSYKIAENMHISIRGSKATCVY